jgi:hypothetical protein
LENPKTKEAKAVVFDLAKIKGFEKLATKPKNAAVIAMDEKGTNAVKGFNNFGNILIEEYRNVNPLMALNCKYLIIAGAEKIFGGENKKQKAKSKDVKNNQGSMINDTSMNKLVIPDKSGIQGKISDSAVKVSKSVSEKKPAKKPVTKN